MLEKMVIRGGSTLGGELPISGAKNAALPILCAAILSAGESEIEGIPDLMDIESLLNLLSQLGMGVQREGGRVLLRGDAIDKMEAPYELVRKMRASVLVLGPLLARFGQARVSMPGGCAIGERPIDQHLKGLEQLGAHITLTAGYVEARAERLVGATVVLDMPTVTGTENIMMAATLALGKTTIVNAAREPEIVDLARCLVSMGAHVSGAGTDRIEIEGVDQLGPAHHRVITDRIELGTYMAAAAIAGGDVLLTGGQLGVMDVVVDRFRAAGVEVSEDTRGIRVRRTGPLKSVSVTTRPYPGFPTDMQAQLMAMMCQATGVSVIEETLFENRFMHVPELKRMGADITLHGNSATIRGVATMGGAAVMATDLRASASLVLAGLGAEGVTEVLRIYHLDRGYEHMDVKLAGVGADIRRVHM